MQESLRSLEEFGKVFDAARAGWAGSCIASEEADVQLSSPSAGLAILVKQLRYRTYTLQRSIEITRGSIERLAAARLYVLIDGRRVDRRVSTAGCFADQRRRRSCSNFATSGSTIGSCSIGPAC